MKPHLLEHLRFYAKEYKKLKPEWKCHIRKTELQNSGMYCTDTAFNINILLPTVVYAVFLILSLKLRKRDLKHCLVSNIISTNTHFVAWNT
jgi:hypothetical protein